MFAAILRAGYEGYVIETKKKNNKRRGDRERPPFGVYDNDLVMVVMMCR
jgi:hypothetical protein